MPGSSQFGSNAITMMSFLFAMCHVPFDSCHVPFDFCHLPFAI